MLLKKFIFYQYHMSHAIHYFHEGFLYILFVPRDGLDLIMRLVLFDWLVTMQNCYWWFVFMAGICTSYHKVPRQYGKDFWKRLKNYFNFCTVFLRIVYFQWSNNAKNARIVHEKTSNQKIYLDIAITLHISN